MRKAMAPAQARLLIGHAMRHISDMTIRGGGSEKPSAKAQLIQLRDPLFELHRLLLEQARAEYEAEEGKVSAQKFLSLLLTSSQFEWLRPFSAVLTATDEALDDVRATEHTFGEVVKQVAGLFAFTQEETPFSTVYKRMIQESPEIASRHGELRTLLPKVPPKWS